MMRDGERMRGRWGLVQLVRAGVSCERCEGIGCTAVEYWLYTL